MGEKGDGKSARALGSFLLAQGVATSGEPTHESLNCSKKGAFTVVGCRSSQQKVPSAFVPSSLPGRQEEEETNFEMRTIGRDGRSECTDEGDGGDRDGLHDDDDGRK